MEDALVQLEFRNEFYPKHVCLNPCFNGRCTRTAINVINTGQLKENVLILVLMEDALVLEKIAQQKDEKQQSLNPCFNGRCTRTRMCGGSPA